MLLPQIEYARAATVADAVDLLAAPNARALAGGQTLVNVMKLRIISPDRVVDVTRIPELREIELGDGELRIGAAVTYDELVESPAVREARPVLADTAAVIADQQVRNRGTIGGNVCLNLSTSHFPPVMRAVGARFTIAGPDGMREVEADDFFRGPFTTAVAAGELLTAIVVPARADGEADAFRALSVGVEGMSIVAAAASVRVGPRIDAARVALGCVADVPVRASTVEERLVGREPTGETVRAAVDGLRAELSPPSDVNASADFRGRMAEVYTSRAILAAIDGTRT
jgi:aerobic carbon-monoxide dehydrogenase medium subunit